MEIKMIKTRKPFVSLFKIHPEIYTEVFNDMKANGFDPNDPLLIWKEEDVLIDGHTRLKAATELKITDIPVILISFQSEVDALQYALKRNANRRYVTSGEKLSALEIIDETKKRGGINNPEGAGGWSGKNLDKNSNLSFCQDKKTNEPSAEKISNILGVGSVQVNKMRTILNYAKNEDVEAAKNDQISIDEAWKRAKAEKEKIETEKKTISFFNRTTDSIEWALWTWNPVTGCKFGCEYCYARDIANRFYPQKFEPTFHKERLKAPQNTPVPSVNEIGEHNVFVCSMADLFGDWVPQNWIQDVFTSIRNAPSWWNFLLLTKNPKRYEYLNFPENVWIGATATNQMQMDKAISVFKKLRKTVSNIFFISCEPFMEKIEINESDISFIDWLIIGGRTRSTVMEAGQPEWEWVEYLLFLARRSNVKVYFKPNLEVRPKEYPEFKSITKQDNIDLIDTDTFIELAKS